MEECPHLSTAAVNSRGLRFGVAVNSRVHIMGHYYGTLGPVAIVSEPLPIV